MCFIYDTSGERTKLKLHEIITYDNAKYNQITVIGAGL